MLGVNARPVVGQGGRPGRRRPGPGRGHPGHGHRHRHARRGRRRGRPLRHRAPVLGRRRRHRSSCCSTCSTARWPARGAAARCSARSSTPSATGPPTPRSSARWPGGSPAAGDNRLLVLLALICLVLGVLTSYVKARAEGVGLSLRRRHRRAHRAADPGARRHRASTGLGVPYALHVALWVLLAGSAVTVGQRFARRPPRPPRLPAAPPAPDRTPAVTGAAGAAAAAPAGGSPTPGSPPAGAPSGCCPSRRPRGLLRPGRRAGRPAATGTGMRQLRANLRVVTGGPAVRAGARRADRAAPCGPTPATGRRPSGCRR